VCVCGSLYVCGFGVCLSVCLSVCLWLLNSGILVYIIKYRSDLDLVTNKLEKTAVCVNVCVCGSLYMCGLCVCLCLCLSVCLAVCLALSLSLSLSLSGY